MTKTCRQLQRALVLLALPFILAACIPAGEQSLADKRSAVQNMKNETLTELFKHKPSVRSQLENAVGYAAFSSANVNVIFASFGGGYGMAKNNRSGNITYMRMGEVGVGLGAGVKDFRLVFIFHTTEAYNRFIEYGWGLGAQADAAAKAGEQGGAVAGEVQIENVTIYQLTQNGLALQATIKGTKYWRDHELN